MGWLRVWLVFETTSLNVYGSTLSPVKETYGGIFGWHAVIFVDYIVCL